MRFGHLIRLVPLVLLVTIGTGGCRAGKAGSSRRVASRSGSEIPLIRALLTGDLLGPGATWTAISPHPAARRDPGLPRRQMHAVRQGDGHGTRGSQGGHECSKRRPLQRSY